MLLAGRGGDGGGFEFNMGGGPPPGGGRHTLRPTSYTLHPTPSTLQPTPYTLHPTPYNLHPPLCTLHPKSCTLHPTQAYFQSLTLISSERKRQNIKGFKDFHVKAKARTMPWLSYMRRITFQVVLFELRFDLMVLLNDRAVASVDRVIPYPKHAALTNMSGHTADNH